MLFRSYDIASVLPYDQQFDVHKIKLAMKVGGKYKLRDIGLHQWQIQAREIRIDGHELIDALRAMAKQLPDEVSTVCAQAREEGLDKPIIDRLAAVLTERALACQKILAGTGE